MGFIYLPLLFQSPLTVFLSPQANQFSYLEIFDTNQSKQAKIEDRKKQKARGEEKEIEKHF